MDTEPTIGIALSGGGHRAALFGLGVLMYLHDAGNNAHVNSIASVSGGSLTNGFVGQECTFPTTTPDEFNCVASRLTKAIARDGTVYRAKITWIYITLALVSFAACWLLVYQGPRWAGALLAFIAFLIWIQYIFGARGMVCASAFGATLLNKDGKRSLLTVLSRDGIDHVLCATELHSAEHVYFSGQFVYSFRLGCGTPGTMKLQDAVQASAAFPVGFPPRWFRTHRFNFLGGTQCPKVIVVSDGGVYDNMAEQWIVGGRRRAERQGMPSFQLSDSLIVVNASPSIQWLPTWKLAIPLLGEFFSFIRIITVLYDNTTAQRRQALVERFKSRQGIPGSFVTIEQTPLTVAQQFANDDSDPSLVVRARTILERFGPDAHKWQDVALTSQNTPTTFRALGDKRALNLLYHSYAVANANLHVIMNYPLLPMPIISRFEELLK